MTGRPTPTLWYEPPSRPESGFPPQVPSVMGSPLIVSSSFQNDVSEKEQRWGAKTVKGSGHQEHIK